MGLDNYRFFLHRHSEAVAVLANYHVNLTASAALVLFASKAPREETIASMPKSLLMRYAQVSVVTLSEEDIVPPENDASESNNA